MMYKRSHYTRIGMTEVDFFMYRLDMSLQISLCGSLMITLITRIFDFCMNRLNMCLQISLSCSLMVALIARIFDSSMYHLNMSFQNLLSLITFHANVAGLVSL